VPHYHTKELIAPDRAQSGNMAKTRRTNGVRCSTNGDSPRLLSITGDADLREMARGRRLICRAEVICMATAVLLARNKSGDDRSFGARSRPMRCLAPTKKGGDESETHSKYWGRGRLPGVLEQALLGEKRIR